MRVPSLKSMLAVAALTVPLAMAQVAAAAPLRFGGTGTASGMLQQVGTAFSAATGIQVEIVPSLGSSGATRALADGNLDIAVSARPAKADEIAAGVRQAMVLRTPFVLATSMLNVYGLKAADLAKIYAAEKPVWPDGAPIKIILRPRSESDTALLGELYPGMDKAIEIARRRADVPVAATDQDNADMADRIVGSLAATTLTQLTTEHHNLRVLPLDEVQPTLANFESGTYRYAKNLYFLVRGDGGAEASRFIAFLRSPPGLKALRQTAVLPDGE